ncbi:MAG: riboflavin synthase [Thaumarchaeota archaeon]|nr:MAG: riboflavin synthase [Nitrososphaerota archaeon]
MFTGIVEGMGKVRSVSKSKKGADTSLRVRLGKLGRNLKRGDSVSINGACLTVTGLSKGEAEFEMVAETTRRTNLGEVKPGDMVNIERSMRVGDRLEGHFVLGHVDDTGIIEDIQNLPSETKIWIKLDKELAKSIVSSVSLIPHTLNATTLGLRRKGESVNIETDILGKYVTRNSPKL